MISSKYLTFVLLNIPIFSACRILKFKAIVNELFILKIHVIALWKIIFICTSSILLDIMYARKLYLRGINIVEHYSAI